LPHLTDQDLKELGLSLGHRKKLLTAIESLSTEATDRADAAADDGSIVRSSAQPEAERRQLTVMFCDLVGSTALSGYLDPEELREVIRAYQGVCTTAIKRYEGFVARYVGDGILAYFGYPLAHEDDAERALHAGLGVVEAVGELKETMGRNNGVDLAVRVGVATGLVIVGDLIGEGASEESAAIGETPNLAARLQGLAEPNAVVIAPNTRRLAAGRFEYTDLGTHKLKGIAGPVHAWRVIAASELASRFDAAHEFGVNTRAGCCSSAGNRSRRVRVRSCCCRASPVSASHASPRRYVSKLPRTILSGCATSARLTIPTVPCTRSSISSSGQRDLIATTRRTPSLTS
jgi:class 3 adenylate cyclase